MDADDLFDYDLDWIDNNHDADDFFLIALQTFLSLLFFAFTSAWKSSHFKQYSHKIEADINFEEKYSKTENISISHLDVSFTKGYSQISTLVHIGDFVDL